MEVQSEEICVVYGLGSKILAVQVKKGRSKVVDGEIESIDQDTNSVSVKDSQSGLTEHVNISEIRSIELTKEFLDDAVALGKWYQNSNGGFEMQSESIPKPAPIPTQSILVMSHVDCGIIPTQSPLLELVGSSKRIVVGRHALSEKRVIIFRLDGQ